MNRGCGGCLFLYHRLLWLCFREGCLHRLCGLNTDRPVAANTAFPAKSRFVPDSLPIGRQK